MGLTQGSALAATPSFDPAETDPFGLSNVGRYSTPTFADLDDDGDLDALVGENDGNLRYFQNTGSATSPAFAAPATNPFGLSDVGRFSAPTFADLDGDGDLDGVVGEYYGDVVYFENTTTPLAVTVAGFTATADGEQVLLRWETVAETNNQGFHLFRSTSASEVGERITAQLVPSQAPGSSEGASYEWVDADVAAGTTYYYWLEAVDLDGTTTRHGPVSATVEVPTAVTVGSVVAQARGGSVAQILLAMGTAPVGWLGWRRRQR